MLNVYGEEILLLIVLAFLILGPKRLPYYAAKLGQAVRSLREMAEGAKTQIKDELGPGFEDIDWRQLDPRQYDPRRIVRDALAPAPSVARGATGTAAASATAGTAGAAAGGPGHPPRGVVTPWAAQVHDPSRPTPYDTDAT